MIRAYVDTNILVDLVLSRQEFLPDAQRVFAIGYDTRGTVPFVTFLI
jgi:predicted nucleic acid-binding protein